MIHFRVNDIELRLEPVESEDRLGSIRFTFTLSAWGSKGRLEYREESVWISYAEIDHFAEAAAGFVLLEGDFEESLPLLDMSDDPVFTLRRGSEPTTLELRRSLRTGHQQGFTWRTVISQECLHRIRDVFQDIEGWW